MHARPRSVEATCEGTDRESGWRKGWQKRQKAHGAEVSVRWFEMTAESRNSERSRERAGVTRGLAQSQRKGTWTKSPRREINIA